MQIKFLNGYWTIVCNGVPVLQCVSLESAQGWAAALHDASVR